MKKLAGLLAFVAALAAAIAVTQYYSKSKTPAPPQTPVPAATNAPGVYTNANIPVTFKTKNVTLDLSAKKAHVTLTLERAPAGGTPPQSVWVWAYFFTPDAPGHYCAGEPVEVKQPFASGGSTTVTVDSTVGDCPAPRTPSSTYYARVNVSPESAFAARLTEGRISYDITQASPVTLEGAQAKKH
jgi:hypothetical protein